MDEEDTLYGMYLFKLLTFSLWPCIRSILESVPSLKKNMCDVVARQGVLLDVVGLLCCSLFPYLSLFWSFFP